MEYIRVSQLTAYEKKRFNKNRTCRICLNEIKDGEKIIMIKQRNKHRVFYNFNHYKCVCEKCYDIEFLEDNFVY